MSRKSLPTANTTPNRSSLPNRANTSVKRSTRQVSSTPTRPKRKRGQVDDGQDKEEKPSTSADLVLGPAKELEAWQDFAADHYEMIEQLPLELHRSFRLLRELDDICTGQTAELQKVIRRYIAKRMNVKDNPEPVAVDDLARPNGEAVGQDEDPAPVPDGEGGLIVPVVPAIGGADGDEEEEQEQIEDRRAFPTQTEEAEDVEMADEAMEQIAGEGTSDGQDRSGARDDEPSHAADTGRASSLLPEIGRLAREMVRNGEEKVALAVGAYNAIDRHIRALDSALSAHEASILLGLRADTNPSAAVEPSGEQEAVQDVDADQEQVTIGMGGGRSRKKRGRKPKGKQVVEAAVEQKALPGPLFDLEVDPNEPRYCYCNNVSYGQMVGCENDECPLEWFHLACIGLTQPPSGKWWCNICKPKTDLDKGGAAGGAHKYKQKRGKGWSRK